MSWQLILVSVSAYGITLFIRTLLEYKFPQLQTQKLWTEVFIRVAPIAIGILLCAHTPAFPYPNGIGDSEAAKLMFGLTAGLFSGMVYGALKGMLKAKGSDAT